MRRTCVGRNEEGFIKEILILVWERRVASGKRNRVVGTVTDHNPHLISADWECEDGGAGGRGKKSERFPTEKEAGKHDRRGIK